MPGRAQLGWGDEVSGREDRRIEVSAADPEDLDALFEELRGVPGVRLEALSQPAAPGDLGAVTETLGIVFAGGGGTALIKLITAVIESRGPHFSLEFRHRRTKVKITADNVEEMLPLLKELLDE